MTTTETIRFEVGKTYSQCHIGDSTLFAHFKIISRTAKSIMVDVRGEVVRRGLSVCAYDNAEQFKPYGNYSMCMIVSAAKGGK